MTYKHAVYEKTGLRRVATYGLLASLFLITTMLFGCEQIQRVVFTGSRDASIRIGFLYSSPLPGTTRNGAELAVHQLNQEGGVNGIPIHLIARDDKHDTSRSVELAEELITKEGILGLIGPDWSRHALRVAPVAQRHEIPMVTTYPTNPTVPNAGDFVFMCAFTDAFQGELISKFAAESLGVTTAAILTETGRAYSEGLSRFFANSFTARGGTILMQQFYAKGDTDFTEQLTAIAEDTPDVLFVPGFVPEVPLAIRQAKEDIGLTVTFLGGDGWDAPELISTGGMALEGSFFINHFLAQPTAELVSEDTRQFVAAYTSMFGILPDGPASLGYDAVRIMVQAMQRSKDLTPRNIRDQIAATTDYSGAAILSRYDENRHAIKSGVINIIKDGEVQLHQVIKP